MKDLIAKRYIKALVKGSSQAEINSFAESLEKLAQASELAKFREILESPYVAQSKKLDFILSTILENRASRKFTNFIKVLSSHKRLDIFDELYGELSSQLAALNKQYIAELFVADAYDDAKIGEIESKFSKKLGVNLSLKQKVVKDGGIKLVVDDLGVEVAFSQERFIGDLKNHILKAF